jgi:hypothetical protein
MYVGVIRSNDAGAVDYKLVDIKENALDDTVSYKTLGRNMNSSVSITMKYSQVMDMKHQRPPGYEKTQYTSLVTQDPLARTVAKCFCIPIDTGTSANLGNHQPITVEVKGRFKVLFSDRINIRKSG